MLLPLLLLLRMAEASLASMTCKCGKVGLNFWLTEDDEGCRHASRDMQEMRGDGLWVSGVVCGVYGIGRGFAQERGGGGYFSLVSCYGFRVICASRSELKNVNYRIVY